MWTNTIPQFPQNIAVVPLGNGGGLLGTRVYYASNGIYPVDRVAPLRAYDRVADVHPSFNFSAIPAQFHPLAAPFVRNTPAGLDNVSAMLLDSQNYRDFHRNRMVMGSIYNIVGNNPHGNPLNAPIAGTFNLQAP